MSVCADNFILKVASRCNLNCKYCYVYNMGDRTYMTQPRVMPDEVVEAFLVRLRNHCVRHQLARVVLIFHGGEPMLAGQDFFRRFVRTAAKIVGPEVHLDLCLQTNGTLLDSDWISVLSELQIGIGISLDGDKVSHDANRVDHAGRGSYDSVANSIGLLQSSEAGRTIFGTVLTVVNLEADPVKMLRHYIDIGLSGVDFLLPDGTYENLPHCLDPRSNDTPYADWLINVFEEWWRQNNPAFSIRIFEEIIDLVLGGEMVTDGIGGRANSVMAIDADGSIEPVDVLKICQDGITKLGYNVLHNELDEALGNDLMRMYAEGIGRACSRCQECQLASVCGGGYLPHRYSRDRGFDNPSIYCKNIARLIAHIQSRVIEALPADIRARMRLRALDPSSILEVLSLA